MPAMAHISSLSEVSPEMPQAPTMSPAALRMSTPPGLLIMRPPLAAASMVKNCGVLAARLARVREPNPMPSAPQALPKAMSKRRMPDLSSRLNATRWPPLSSTATVSGARLLSRPFFSATSTMVEACASVIMRVTPVQLIDVGRGNGQTLQTTGDAKYSGRSRVLRLAAVGPIDRDAGNLRAARAVALGLLVAGERAFDERQVDAARLRLGKHRLHVLDAAVDVESDGTGIAAFEHGGDAGAARLEHVGPAGGLAQQVRQPRRIELHRSPQRQGLAERLPVDHERQVDDEFQHRAGADRAGMFEPAAELLQDRPRPRRVGIAASHHADQLALARRTGRTADRTLDEGGALGAHDLGERYFGRRQHRAHLDEQPAAGSAAEQARLPLIDRIERRGVGQDGDDGLAALHQLGRRADRLGAGDRLGLLGRAIPHRDVVADLDQARGDGGAHFPDPGNADAHERPSRTLLGRTISDDGAMRKRLARAAGRCDSHAFAAV